MTILGQLAEKAFEALDNRDAGAFGRLCAPQAELIPFVGVGPTSSLKEAYEHVHGPAAIAAWFGGIFAAYPELAFSLRAVDEIGNSAVCHSWVGFGPNAGTPWSFVLTARSGQILGFEVFHPEVDARHVIDDYRTVFVGNFQVRGRASDASAPRPCAWTYHRQTERDWSLRVYPREAEARKALRG